MPRHPRPTPTGPRGALLLALGLALTSRDVGAEGTRGAWSTGLAVTPDGAFLPEPPATRPDRPIPPGTDPVDLAMERTRRGDLQGAVLLLEDWLAGAHRDLKARGGGERWIAARFQLGLLYMRQERHNLASLQFTKVRAGEGPLASEASWYEALCDELRDRHAVAARECVRYRERWPSGSHAGDCLALMGEAYAADGPWSSAQEAFQLVLDADPEGTDAEAARLGQALALIRRSPSAAVNALQGMALDYSFATTPVRARAALAELAATGLETSLPDDVGARKRRLFSALRAREYTLARGLWQQLTSDPDPEVRAWTTEHVETMGWRGRDFEALVEHFARRYEASPSPEGCWMVHRAAARGALWKEAAAWGERGMKEHKGSWRWAHAQDEVARAWMLAGDQDRARELWDQVAKRGGAAGAAARWYGALSAWLARDLDDAAQRMAQVRTTDGARSTRALYYLAKLAAARGEEAEARELYAQVAAEDDEGWYALLASSRLQPHLGPSTPLVRHGAWPYPAPSGRPEPAALPVRAPPGLAPRAQAGALIHPPTRPIAWSRLATPPSTAALLTTPAPPAAEPLTGEAPVDCIHDGVFYDRDAARLALARFVSQHSALWPQLPAIQALADAGATDLSGELMARLYDELERAQRGRTPRDAQLRAVRLSTAEWRPLFLYTRSWYLVSRFCMGLDKSADTPEQRREALALAFPAAFPEHVWRWSRAHRVDPLLTLGVMRQESAYKSWAVSSANAVGLLQILPVTGALVARDQGLDRFSPRDLLEPATSIRYGTWYLSRLLVRFHGRVPLAVAAYNAGPGAVGGWLAARPEGEEVDDFVELIPVDETRNYVRRVLGFYALNVAVHGPEGARAVLDLPTAGDDPTVIDY
ncbi:MAG: transglycosylase SLT domain-containing protein [Pseudomonadota bacterium]